MSVFFHHPRRSYYSRVFVPKKLLPFFNGRVECWKALRTSVLSDAKRRGATWEAQGRRLFQTLEHRGHMMTRDQVERLVASWINAELEASEDLRSTSPEPDEDQWEGQKDILGDQLEDAWSDLVSNRLSRVDKTADDLLAGDGVKLAKDSTAYKRLCRELLEAKMQVLKTEMQRMDGRLLGDGSKQTARWVCRSYSIHRLSAPML